MFKITIIAVGKVKESFWQAALKEYQKRLKPYVVLEIVEVKAEPFLAHNKLSARTKENDRLIKILDKYWSSLCDEAKLNKREQNRLFGSVIKSEFCLLGWK